jgi:hypothetical protein
VIFPAPPKDFKRTPSRQSKENKNKKSVFSRTTGLNVCNQQNQ